MVAPRGQVRCLPAAFPLQTLRCPATDRQLIEIASLVIGIGGHGYKARGDRCSQVPDLGPAGDRADRATSLGAFGTLSPILDEITGNRDASLAFLWWAS
jgi:hypothetical protein